MKFLKLKRKVIQKLSFARYGNNGYSALSSLQSINISDTDKALKKTLNSETNNRRKISVTFQKMKIRVRKLMRSARKSWVYVPPVFENDINKRHPSEICQYFEFLCLM
ncbi:unnamed protein product [Gordionus sp. m RMFG-2023]